MTAVNLIVVEGDGMDRIRHMALRFCQCLLYPFAMLPIEFANLGVKSRHVGEIQYRGLSVPTHHQVCLKVTQSYPIIHDVRPLLDGYTIRNRPSEVLAPATIAAYAFMLQEAMKCMVCKVYSIMASSANPYPMIQTFIAYRTQTSLTTDDADDLWAPFIMD
jgi:hypothetical protein